VPVNVAGFAARRYHAGAEAGRVARPAGFPQFPNITVAVMPDAKS
jgi:hypothetical protein